jgi:hypothetical protein
MVMSKPPTSGSKMRRRPPCRNFGGDARSIELSARIVAGSRTLSTTLRTMLSDIAEYDRTEAWRGTGAVSMSAWVVQQCGVASGSAAAWVRAAAKLEVLPLLGDALADGSLSLDAVALLAEVATPETEAALVEGAEHWSIKQIRELVARQRQVTDAAAARQYDKRSWTFNDARRTMWAAFTDDDYAEAKGLLVGLVSRKQCEAEDKAGHKAGGRAADPLGYVPLDQQLYDAVMDLWRVGSGRSGGGSGGGSGGSGGGSRPTMVVHAPLALLMAAGAKGGSGGPGGSGGSGGALDCCDFGVAEIQGLGPISAEVARRLACDADITFSVEREDGCILDQGRARREPTTAQRIEIARRDNGCRLGSCSFKEFTHVHHVKHWVNGGETNLDNLITLCGRHHRAVHELGWKMDGDANAIMKFTSPHGDVLTSAPSPTWRNVPMRR